MMIITQHAKQALLTEKGVSDKILEKLPVPLLIGETRTCRAIPSLLSTASLESLVVGWGALARYSNVRILLSRKILSVADCFSTH